MKKIILLVLFIVLTINTICAQSKKTKFSIGAELSVPTFSGIPSYGIGGGICLEHFFNKRIAGDINVSFTHFRGNIFDFYKHDTLNGFSIIPVLVGGKYFFTDKFYVSGAAGLVIGFHNAGNHLALSPGIGLLLPLSAKSKIELGVKLTGIPTGYSFSENNFLNKGGYSFLTFRAAYVF